MEIPAVEVRFQNLCASREVHVGSRSLPTLSNAARSLLEGLASPFLRLAGISRARKKTLVMLDNVSGVLKPVSAMSWGFRVGHGMGLSQVSAVGVRRTQQG